VNATLTLGAALLLGLAAGGHCLLMCGGITAALGLATAKTAAGNPRPTLLAAYQLGRVASYSLAGLLFGGLMGALIAVLDVEAVRLALRTLSAAAMMLAALVVIGRVRDRSCARPISRSRHAHFFHVEACSVRDRRCCLVYGNACASRPAPGV